MTDEQGAELTILVPMLGRPHRVAPLLASIQATVPAAEVLWLLTPGDHAVVAEVDRAGGRALSVGFARGDYARKINLGYRVTDRPLLFLAACDLQFHPGWYQAALDQFADGIGVVGTNDMGNPRVVAGEHATHSLVTRAYADQGATADGAGEILHEGYWHEYCDDELVQVARHRGVWAFAANSHVEHLHPDYGKAPSDHMYRRRRPRMRQGAPLFAARRSLWT
ncbi:hypothetical protein MXD61_06830 [Frankia sp. AgPm24]|uniref:hypothetical protein n=1 Tax=Frankia sp. AgPm24 TaxID=631128 RepID=UPI00200D28A6|nr:hypothetical protein [Frankia sp. AgPm24]MCK9921605.1 hypothetical protein [Frankia sp. AgPm24]